LGRNSPLSRYDDRYDDRYDERYDERCAALNSS
jgi:hypothetical protein